MPKPILRTRNQDLSQKVARSLAGLTQRTFCIKRITLINQPAFEVHPQKQGLPRRQINAFIKLADALVQNEAAIEKAEEN